MQNVDSDVFKSSLFKFVRFTPSGLENKLICSWAIL